MLRWLFPLLLAALAIMLTVPVLALGASWLGWDAAAQDVLVQMAHTVLPGLAWQNGAGNVLGLYQHGLFEDANVLRALFGASVPTLDSVFDGLADFIETHFDAGALAASASAPRTRTKSSTATPPVWT